MIKLRKNFIQHVVKQKQEVNRLYFSFNDNTLCITPCLHQSFKSTTLIQITNDEHEDAKHRKETSAVLWDKSLRNSAVKKIKN